MEEVRLLRHTFTCNYIKEHGRWPHLEFGVEMTQLRKLHDLQVQTLEYCSYPMLDWEDCGLKPMLKFTPPLDYLDVVDKEVIRSWRLKPSGFEDAGLNLTLQRRVLIGIVSQLFPRVKGNFRVILSTEIPSEWKITLIDSDGNQDGIVTHTFASLVSEIMISLIVMEVNLMEQASLYIPFLMDILDEDSISGTLKQWASRVAKWSVLSGVNDFDSSSSVRSARDLEISPASLELSTLFGMTEVYESGRMILNIFVVNGVYQSQQMSNLPSDLSPFMQSGDDRD
jgi:hypothetical protein